MVYLIDNASSYYRNPQSQVPIPNNPNPLSYGHLTPQSPGQYLWTQSGDIRQMNNQMVHMLQEMDSEFSEDNEEQSTFEPGDYTKVDNNFYQTNFDLHKENNNIIENSFGEGKQKDIGVWQMLGMFICDLTPLMVQTAKRKSKQATTRLQSLSPDFNRLTIEQRVSSSSRSGDNDMDFVSLQSPKRVGSDIALDFNRMSKKALSQRPAMPEMDLLMDSSSPSHLSSYNVALHPSQSNPSQPAQPTTTPQIDDNGNNAPNKLTRLSASGFDVPSSSGGPIFRTIDGIFTKYLNDFHQANIMRGNNAIEFSFNDNFLVRLSGRHSSPATIAHQDEMHQTKEGPDAPIKTRSAESQGNHIPFSDRHQVLDDNFSPNDEVDRNSGISMCMSIFSSIPEC
jgi:hypothetical protein